jgi:hypothetical protein
MAARDQILELKRRIGESMIGQEAVIDPTSWPRYSRTATY